MGILVSTMRLQYLLQSKADLEYKIQLITQSKMGLMQSTNELMSIGNDYDPDSPIVKTLQQRQAKLKVLEQQLDLQMTQYQNRLKAVETEIESARGVIDKNIQSSFKY